MKVVRMRVLVVFFFLSNYYISNFAFFFLKIGEVRMRC